MHATTCSISCDTITKCVMWLCTIRMWKIYYTGRREQQYPNVKWNKYVACIGLSRFLENVLVYEFHFQRFQRTTTNQSLRELMKRGDQGGLSPGLPEKTLLVLEQGPGPGTYTSAWPETDWQLKVKQIQIKPLQCECQCLKVSNAKYC